MEPRPGQHRIGTGWWTLILITAVVVFLFVTAGTFAGIFRSSVPVTLTADRAGLVMEPGAKVQMRGVQVGTVGGVSGSNGAASLKLEIDPDQIRYIPANVDAQIQVTTAFGAKFVDLISPERPSSERLSAGAVLQSKNVSTEVNTVFENVVDLLKMVDPAKLNAVLSAVAEGVRGQGERIGQATVDLNMVLRELNARSDTMREDWRSFKKFNDTFDAAAEDIVTVLDAASTTSVTVVNQSNALDTLLLNVVGLSRTGTELLAASKDDIVAAVNTLEPTTNLLNKYSPVYKCWLQGATWYLENGGMAAWGGADGRSAQLDVGLLLGNDPYAYPQHLPVIAAKGGPGGQPGCGSLPDPSKNFPVRQLITNTGWGTGLDIRPNPGIGSPCWANYFPVTRAVPEPASVRSCLPGPAPGPIPYPGAPPYGAPLYGPGGIPLWPGVAPAQPNPPPAEPAPPVEPVP